MPNQKGGKKFKGRKKNEFVEQKQLRKKRESSETSTGEEYAQVIGAKGNGRFELMCCDGGKVRLGVVCGKMRKRVWINRGDLVLICKWEDMSDDTKCSIVHKYPESDAKRLLKDGDLPDNFKLNLDDFEEESNGDYFMPHDSDESDESDVDTESDEEEKPSIKDIDIDDI
jgi:translation initiation factor 1A